MDQIKSSQGGIPVETARIYFQQLLSAVNYCHSVKKIVHRDIKPKNLMLRSDGRIILCGFGIKQILDEEDDINQSNYQTICFLAPEVFKAGNIKEVHSHLLDIWACGITLFNMLTGIFPFEGKNIISLQANILTEEANLEIIEDS